MRIWSSILGVKGVFKQVPESEYLAGMPENLAREIGEGHAYQAEFGWDGGDPTVVHPNDVSLDCVSAQGYC